MAYCDKHNVNSPCMECLIERQIKAANDNTDAIIKEIQGMRNYRPDFEYFDSLKKGDYRRVVRMGTGKPKLTLFQRLFKFLFGWIK